MNTASMFIEFTRDRLTDRIDQIDATFLRRADQQLRSRPNQFIEAETNPTTIESETRESDDERTDNQS